MAYNLETALAIDQLLQQGIPLAVAFDQLGIPQDQQASYQLGEGAFVVPAVNEPFTTTPVSPSEAELQAREDARDAELARTLGPTPVSPSEAELQAREDARDAELARTLGGQNTSGMGAEMRAAITRAQNQNTLQQRYNQSTGSGDWRVRLRLASGADYLYLDPDAKNGGQSILGPLIESGGVIFPYVPTIGTSYTANYDSRDLIHSNYRGYFYRSSRVGDITINGTFTAQDTKEANYLLAVIHFFRSATKMFYGQDKQRGTPPPLVMLSGFGEFQFNNHPCLISNFSYNLPNNVDYIRTTPVNQGQNLVVAAPLVSSSPSSTIQSAWNRINSLVNLATGGKVSQGASPGVQDLAVTTQTLSGTTKSTYVPTKMEIQITLLPVQTRSQVSQQFSLKEFANGNQLKGGFW